MKNKPIENFRKNWTDISEKNKHKWLIKMSKDADIQQLQGNVH